MISTGPSAVSCNAYCRAAEDCRRTSQQREAQVAAPQFLVHSPKDNVGVIVIEGLVAGTDMLGVITETDSTTKAKANHDIPIGHKVALVDLKQGDTVIKYGEDVGRIVADVKKGDHVHTHNMRTKRW